MAQSLSNVLLHIIFSTKNRHSFIDEQIEPELYAYMASIAISHGSYVHKIGGFYDHVHLLVTLPRPISISTYLEEIKKNLHVGLKQKENRMLISHGKKAMGYFLSAPRNKMPL